MLCVPLGEDTRLKAANISKTEVGADMISMVVEPSKCNVRLQKQNVRRSVHAQDEVLKKKPYVMYGGEPAHVSPKIIYHRGTCHPPVSNSHLQCWRCSALMRTRATDGAETFQN